MTAPAELTRRSLLGAGVAAIVLAACGDGDGAADDAGTGSTTTTGSSGGAADTTATTATTATEGPAAAGPTLTAADFDGLGTCRLLPEQTAGPFPLDEQFDRRDITEGVDGQPMRLGFRVVDAACAPVAGAAVEVWHCDATGDYSAFTDGGGGKDEGSGTTFLRGTRTAGDDGIVEFLTVVPGWYPGRAVHIHLRVHVDGDVVRTSQVYFDPDMLAEVYAAAPYDEFGLPDTSNERDGIAGDPGADGTLLHTSAAETSAGTGTLALLNLGIPA